MSAGLIGAKLPRLAGMDMIITLTPYGKFPMLMDTFISSGYMMQMPLGNIRPVFAMPGGGTTPGHVEDIIRKFGNEVIIAAGGAIHGHPMGPAAGARAFRQAMEAAMTGISTAEAAEHHRELREACRLWGVYSEPKSSLFDLKP